MKKKLDGDNQQPDFQTAVVEAQYAAARSGDWDSEVFCKASADMIADRARRDLTAIQCLDEHMLLAERIERMARS